MTPKSHAEEDLRLVALIRALESDINDPVSLQQSIARDEAAIVALQRRVEAAKDRQAKLPELLATARERLKLHRAQRPDVDAKVRKLMKLKEMMNELLRDIDSEN